MRFPFPRPAALCLAVLLGVHLPAAPVKAQQAYTLTVSAGDFERRGAVVSFELPDAHGALRLVDDAGRPIAFQADRSGRGWFVLPHLPAGTTAAFRLEAAPDASPEADRVAARRVDGRVDLSVDGRPLLSYHAEPKEPPPGVDPLYRRGGYLHPVRTPSGVVVTDDYPPNHLHQNGIWAAWTSTRFQGRRPDFWNLGDGTGTVSPVALEATWSGPVHGGLRARHRYVDLSAPDPTAALDETWELFVYGVSADERPYRIFDLVVTQRTATADTLHLPEYRYGGVGFRGRWEWNGAENTFFLTSEGKDRTDGHATRARWAHVWGLVDGEPAGLAVLGHPENFEAPQPMRIHPTEPFFNYAPSQAGDWAIAPDTPYTARYRFVTLDGPPNAALLERLWLDYAFPPSVTLTPAP